MINNVTALRYCVMAGRKSSLLSKGQREYLGGENEVKTKDQERVRRARIRDRVQDGVRDFGLLWRHLDPSDREQIFGFDKLHGDSTEIEAEEGEFVDGLVGMIALVYGGFKEQGFGPEYFEALVEEAILEAEGYYPDFPGAEIELSHINVDIEVNRYTGGQTALEYLLGQESEFKGGEATDQVYERLEQEGIIARRDMEEDSES